MAARLQNKYSCNKCGSDNNKVTALHAVHDDHISKCETQCDDCQHADFWDFGEFKSNETLKVRKARTYMM